MNENKDSDQLLGCLGIIIFICIVVWVVNWWNTPVTYTTTLGDGSYRSTYKTNIYKYGKIEVQDSSGDNVYSCEQNK